MKRTILAYRNIKNRGASHQAALVWLIALALFAITVLLLLLGRPDDPQTSAPQHGSVQPAERPSTPSGRQTPVDRPQPPDSGIIEVDDDSRTLWASPTNGGALDLS